MPHLSQPLSAGLPSIDIWVAVSGPRALLLKSAAKSMPSPVRARLLIDTGATTTCLDPRVLQTLGLAPTGRGFMRTPSTGSTLHPCNTFDVSLTITHATAPLFLDNLAVFESDFSGQGIDGLIGRDVLASCLLIYDGQAQSYTLSF